MLNMKRVPAFTRHSNACPALQGTSSCKTTPGRRVSEVRARAVVRGDDQAVANSSWQALCQGLQKALSAGVTACAAASMVLTPLPALAEGPRVVRLPASSNPEIFSAQRTMVEAWTIVGESFVDPEFNALDWPEELRQHMIAAYTSDAAPSNAWGEINKLLSELGDPYTRRIEPEEYQAFRVSADGELQGIGLLIANELTTTGHLRVLAPIKGGPADRAGILPGDEVISINGEDTRGWSGDRAAKVLRGKGGTEVNVRLSRRTDGIPGVPSRPEPLDTPAFKEVEVALRREAVAISPVYGTLLASPAGTPSVGYVRLSQFSGNAANEMRKAVATLKDQGAGRFILDLRSNPGGLVKAGVDVAAMWLDGEKTVFTVAERDQIMVQTTETKQPALSDDPLVVLVDNMSASASEIVSGALHDNHRALLMGDSATYGKGRIQSVFELQDGSALFVTVARYQTPAGTEIDMKGIRPDRSCIPGARVPAFANPAAAAPARNALGAPVHRVSSGPPLRAPPLVDASGNPSSFMPGVPLDPSTETLLLDALQKDRCVLAAEQYLDSLPAPPPKVPRTLQQKLKGTPAKDLYLAIIQARGSL